MTKKLCYKKAQKILNLLRWAEFLNANTKLPEGKTYIEILVNHLQPKMSLQSGERDLIVMQHLFKIEWPGASKLETRKSTLVAMGEKKGPSAMSTLVGLPTAISTQLILDGVITKTGVTMPNTKDVYGPIAKLLAENGVKLTEECE